jgi:hypothetical protein
MMAAIRLKTSDQHAVTISNSVLGLTSLTPRDMGDGVFSSPIRSGNIRRERSQNCHGHLSRFDSGRALRVSCCCDVVLPLRCRFGSEIRRVPREWDGVEG